MKYAFKILMRIRKTTALRTAQIKAVGVNKTEPIEIPVEAQVNAYLRLEDLYKPNDSGFASKLMIFFATLAVAIAVFGTTISFSAALIILGVLIIHEIGHYIAMLIFGYSDKQILFMPFGAATLGHKKDANALQKAAVFLSGPVLGLIVGTICAIAGVRTELKPLFFCGSLSLVLNYINLLPIVPLDGGRLFELALFSRVPVFKSVFLIISLLIMAIAAILLKDPVLIFFGIVLIIGARNQILINTAHSKIKKQIKRRQIKPDKESILFAIFPLLKQKAFAKLTFGQKCQISKSLVTELMQKPPGLAETVFSLVLYFVVLVLPILIAVPIFIFLAVKDGV